MMILLKQPLNLLILTGIICQGYAWDNDWAPLIYAFLGALAIMRQPKAKLFSPNVRALILLLSFVFFKLMSEFWGYGFNRLIYLAGNFLFVYQLIHLLEDSRTREKKTAFLISLIHIGAGTQVIVDFKALIIIMLALTLIPLTLRTLARNDFPQLSVSSTIRYFPRCLLESLSLGLIMVLFFVAFPRFGFQSRQMRPLMTGAGAATTPSKELDSAGSGAEGGRQLIFRGKMDNQSLEQKNLTWLASGNDGKIVGAQGQDGEFQSFG
jgi:hypothetical protein